MRVDSKEATKNGTAVETNKRFNGDQNGANRPPIRMGHPSAFLFLMGICLTSIVSCGIYLYRSQYISEGGGTVSMMLTNLPEITYRQALTLCIVSTLFLLVFIYQTRSELFMASLGMPMVSSACSSLPYIGQAPLFLKHSPWDLTMNWHRKYGPTYVFGLLGQTVVAVAQPDYLKIILQSGIRNVKKDVHFAYKPFLPILGHGIVTSEGQSWMKQRLKMSAALRIDVLEVIPRITLKAVQRLMKKMDGDGTTTTTTVIELAEALRHLTLQVISETFLSLSAEESDSTFAQMYLPIVVEGHLRVWNPQRAYMFFTPSFWRHRRQVARLNNYVCKLIRDRWALRQTEKKKSTRGGEREQDMLDRVLDTYEKDFPGEDLTDAAVNQFRDEMKTFMLAGHETSAAMMTWALYELMGNSELMKEVSAEGQSVFGKPTDFDWCADGVDHTSLPSREKLAELVLAEGCLKESLRKYSVVPTVTRRNIAPLQLGPHTLPKGCTLMLSIQSVHHDATYWPDPMKFDPRRFTNLEERPIKPYTFLPFIDGPRNCLGQHLALLESKMVLGLLTQRYNIKPAGGEKVITELFQNQDPRHRYMVPVIPGDELLVEVTRKDA